MLMRRAPALLGGSVGPDERAMREDGGDELAIRVTPPVQRLHDAVHVELDRAMLHLGPVGTAVDEHPACRATYSWQTDTPRIEHADAADLPIRRIVRVTAHHPIGLDPHEEMADLMVR